MNPYRLSLEGVREVQAGETATNVAGRLEVVADGRVKYTHEGVTPPLDFDCNAGPGHRCVPTAKPSGPGEYAIDQWDTEIWKGLNFVMEEGHYFHYRFVAQNDPSGDDGYGTCQFTAQAFGDLDGDGVFSTFERVGVAEVYGVNPALGLYIDQELE